MARKKRPSQVLPHEKETIDSGNNSASADIRLQPRAGIGTLPQKLFSSSGRHPHLIGYLFLLTVAIMIYASHMMMFMMSLLFLYLISDFITNDIRRFAPFIPKALLFSILYIAIVAITFMMAYKVIPDFVKTVPGMAEDLQVKVISEFKKADQRWDLKQYIDFEEVKALVVKSTTGAFRFLMDNLSPLYKGFIHFVFALVINLLLYHDTSKVDRVFNRKPDSLMHFLYQFTKERVQLFYYYFKRVMGGQLIISAINTAISTVVILLLDLPYPVVMIFTVFFCGLLPAIGNLFSNTVLIINAFVSIGPWGAGVCVALLVFIHKLEYFLNSKIIGSMVELPMIITLASLLICEMLLGFVGMILAIPLFLTLRHELEYLPHLQPGSREGAA